MALQCWRSTACGRVEGRNPLPCRASFAWAILWAVSAIFVAGCGGTSLSRLAIGDCVSGAIALDGAYEVIDCETEAVPNHATHYRVVGVGTDAEPPSNRGIACVQDDQHVVCYEKYR